MPEYPDLEVYAEAIERVALGSALETLRLANPFVLRTAELPPAEFAGRRLTSARRREKRLALGFEGDLFAVIHLMIAGRLHWRRLGAGFPGKAGLAAFDFEGGTLLLTEASSKKRAALHLVRGADGVEALLRGGVEPLDCSVAEFAATLRRENHTLKRSLTDPRLFSGIGNSYSDEILHRAQLSPVKLTSRITDEEIERLHSAIRSVLTEWAQLLRTQTGDGFPEKVTAFRPEMAVHGRFGQPCPRCGGPVQRIVYAENESNYCPACQTEGKLLADRAFSRLLKQDWPRTVQEMEERMATFSVKKPGDDE